MGLEGATEAMRSATSFSMSPLPYSPRSALKRTKSSNGVPTRTSDSGKSSRRSIALFQVTSFGVASKTATA